MKVIKTAGFTLFPAILTILLSCSTENTLDDVPTTGTLDITVLNAADESPLANVQLLVIADQDDKPVTDALLSDVEGKASLKLDVGSLYYLTTSAQGFENSPPHYAIPAARFTVSAGQTTFSTLRLKTQAIGDGYLSGTLNDAAAAGALVVASSTTGSQAYSSRTDINGNYKIHNLPADNYNLKAWFGGFSSNTVNATVSTGETMAPELIMSPASGEMSGTLTFNGINPTNIEVQLVHPLTGDRLPGLSVKSELDTYSLPGIAEGSYLARASYNNDGIVMAPDWIAANGQPMVSITASMTTTQDFTLTNAAAISGPSNSLSKLQPTIVSETTPTFSWPAFTDASHYIVEVSDLDGNILWGGFNADFSVRNMAIPADTRLVTYNTQSTSGTESTALGPDLVDGGVYRWRLYVSKDTTAGWELLSASEQQMGYFKIDLSQAP